MTRSHPTGPEPRRAILLNVDWTLLRPAATATELWLAAMEKRPPNPLPVRTRETPITVRLPHREQPATMFHRPAVIRALRDLPDRIEVFWLTSWMTNCERLAQLQSDLGLPLERIRQAPLPTDAVPGRAGLPTSARLVQHWKFQTVTHFIRSNPHSHVLWVDDEVGHVVHHLVAADLRPRLHYLRPASWNCLLTEADAARISRWAAGELPVLRYDRNDYRPDGTA